MSKVFCLIFAFIFIGFFSSCVPTKQKGKKLSFISLPDKETPKELLLWSGKISLVTKKAIYTIENQALKELVRLDGITTVFNSSNQNLWIGTEKGLFKLNSSKGKLEPMLLTENDIQPQITCIMEDTAGILWVGAFVKGVYTINKEEVIHNYGSMTVLSGAATPDGAVWIGSNAGLFVKKGDEWIRYSEEGVSGNEIPDNIVEQIIADRLSNVWIIMSEGLALMPASGVQDGHLPSYDFIGKSGNKIYDILHYDTGYLFATKLGLLYLDGEALGEHHAHELNEIGSERVKNKAFLLTADQLGLPDNLAVANIISLVYNDKNKSICLLSSEGIAYIRSKDLNKVLQRLKTQKTHSH